MILAVKRISVRTEVAWLRCGSGKVEYHYQMLLQLTPMQQQQQSKKQWREEKSSTTEEEELEEEE